LARAGGDAIIIDLADAHDAMRRRLEAIGFAAERPFYRMVRGPLTESDPAVMVAAAGPEFG
jgi:hypothetical protein